MTIQPGHDSRKVLQKRLLSDRRVVKLLQLGPVGILISAAARQACEVPLECEATAGVRVTGGELGKTSALSSQRAAGAPC